MIRAALSIARNITGIRAPVLLQLKPTYRCNMKCGFCTVWDNKIKELGTWQFCEIIRQGKALGAGVANFSGGEPLLRKDIVELVGFAKKNGFVTMMNSNGYLMEKHAARLAGILDHLILSLDFPTAKEHDGFRGCKGAAARAIAGLKLAKKLGVSTRINCVVIPQNRDKLGDMVKLAKELGVKISFLPFIPERMQKEQGVLKISIEEYAKEVKSLKIRHPEIGPEGFFIEAILKQDFRCRATDTVINVQPDGRFELPCEVLPIAYGNALDLKREYRSKKVIDISKKNGKYEFCRGCASQCSLLPSLLMNPFNAIDAYLKRN